MEITGPGISQVAGSSADLKESLALDDQVQRVIGLREITLRKDHFVGGRARPQPQLKTGRYGGLLARGSAWLDHGLLKQVLKLRSARFEAGSVRVGNIIRDVV